MRATDTSSATSRRTRRRRSRDAPGKTIDEYEFGDISASPPRRPTWRPTSSQSTRARRTTSLATSREALLRRRPTSRSCEDTFNELPSALWQQLFGSLEKQRKGSRSLSSSGPPSSSSPSLVFAAATGFSVAAAWTIASARAGASPLAPGRWPPPRRPRHPPPRAGPEMLPLRFGGAIAGVRSTRRAVFAVEGSALPRHSRPRPPHRDRRRAPAARRAVAPAPVPTRRRRRRRRAAFVVWACDARR